MMHCWEMEDLIVKQYSRNGHKFTWDLQFKMKMVYKSQMTDERGMNAGIITVLGECDTSSFLIIKPRMQDFSLHLAVSVIMQSNA